MATSTQTTTGLESGEDFLKTERIRAFRECLVEDEIRLMLNKGERRLRVNMNDLQQKSRELYDGLLFQPFQFLPLLEEAIKTETIAIAEPQHEVDKTESKFYAGLVGSFGSNTVSPRTLDSTFLNKLISLEGIVTRCSLVRPKVVKSVHYNETNKTFHFKRYHDATMSTDAPSTSVYPQEDEEGNAYRTEYGYSVYKDHQTISIQEMPERAPAGQLPRSVDVIMDDDLVDRVKPGDRVQLVGIYRSLGNRNASSGSSTFRTLILGNNVVLLSSKGNGGIASSVPTDADIRNINKIAKKKNVFELLSQSLAPSIYGHDYIKKAILLMLLGGMEKNLANGTHLRGDINILMVGDPSTAKSQLLRFVLNTAPLAIATTGRGSSGVGLTAAVTQDKETGERRLEAGAMVLADKGVVCIDEFDKMSDTDRVAIHEVMEQQTVTIAKAGIHTTLNARCSVVAAANPNYGQYDVHKDPHKNINLPDSLLSRFDLLFIVTDDIEEARDRMVSEHVLKMHQYRDPRLEEGQPVREGQSQMLGVGVEEADTNRKLDHTPVYERFNPLLHSGVTVTTGRGRDRRPEVLSIPFVKKYIHYAKTRCKPVLTLGASNYITATYSALRNDEMEGNQRRTSPMTARTLETLIRLATAHAKSRLSSRVEEKDAEAAEEILRFALFKEVVKSRRKRRKLGEDVDMRSDSSDNDEDDDEDGADGDEMDAARPRRNQRAAARNASARSAVDGMDGMDEDEDVDDEDQDGSYSGPRSSRRTQSTRNGTQEDSQTSYASSHRASSLIGSQTQTQTQTQSQGPPSQDRIQAFQRALGRLLNTDVFEDECAQVGVLVERVNEGLSEGEKFGMEEAKGCLRSMSDRNLLMYTDGDLVWKV